MAKTSRESLSLSCLHADRPGGGARDSREERAKERARSRCTLSTPEGRIENMILHWLKSKRIFHFKVKSVGTFDPIKKVYRTTSPLYRKGVSDIIAIYNGKPVAIEVKSKTGRLTDDQKEFQYDFCQAGGVAFVARSVEDVEERLHKWSESCAK